MAQMGMDVEAVESVGRQLKQSAASVDPIVGSLDNTVSGLAQLWDGPDAQRLIQSWPNFRKSLIAAQASIAGLGQSALNNASEQRQASGARGDGGGGAISAGGTSGDGSSASPSAVPSPQSQSITPQEATSFAGPQLQAWLASVKGQHIDVDHAYGAQCVDLLNNYVMHLYPGKSFSTPLGTWDYAKQAYDHASTQYFDKLPPTAVPQPGDVICIGGVPGVTDLRQYGHVAIVESVDSAGVHVMQQDGNNSATGVAFEGVVPPSQMQVLQGYLRPKAI